MDPNPSALRASTVAPAPAGLDRQRRRWLGAAAATALAALPGRGLALGGDPSWGGGGRLTADFEPLAATWLGYDAGHEAFTVELAAALQPHVPLKFLLRDAVAEAQVRALLSMRGLSLQGVTFMHDPQSLFFVRDAAVFARRAGGGLGVVDFRWSHYGWATWCRRRHAGDADAERRCAWAGDSHDAAAALTEAADGLDRRLAASLGAALWRTPLAMEGGGVEVNGQGLLIANEALWRSRHPQWRRDTIERELRRLPGVRKLIWLPAGLAHDPLHRATIVGRHVGWGTGGHTDQFVRFADRRTVLLAWVDEAEAARHPVMRLNQQRMQRNFELLSHSSDGQGRPLRVLKLPLPRIIERRVQLSASADQAHSRQWSADAFPAHEKRRQADAVMQVASSSYLNFVVANDLVLLPDYRRHGTPAALQDRVQQVLASAFPGRRLALIDAIGTNWVGGGAHCATLSEPASDA
jgi:agmatine deiminase